MFQTSEHLPLNLQTRGASLTAIIARYKYNKLQLHACIVLYTYISDAYTIIIDKKCDLRIVYVEWSICIIVLRTNYTGKITKRSTSERRLL